MKFWKRIVCGGLGALLLFAAGCAGGDLTWAYRAEGQQPPVGVYIYNMIDTAAEWDTKLREQHADEEGYEVPAFKDQLVEAVDDQNGADYIRAGAQERMREYIAVENKFAEMGLALDDTQRAYAANTAASMWGGQQEFYEPNGIAESSLRMIIENSLKRQTIFGAMYGEGGEREIPPAEQKSAFEKNFAKVDLFILYKLTGEEADGSKKNAEAYLERAKKGEDFYELIYEEAKASAADEEAAGAVEKPAPGSRLVFLYKDMGSSFYSDALIEGALAAKPGEPVLVEDSSYYYILNPHDVLEDPADLESYSDEVLRLLKGDEYEAAVEEWAAAVQLTPNEPALSRYVPAKLKMEE